MTNRLVTAAQYLTYPEAVALYQALSEAGVTALVKSCGPPSFPFGEGLYFQLQIDEENLAAAQPVLEVFSEKQAKNSLEPPSCPRCRSGQVWPEQRLPWWKKIIFAGTTVFRCQQCDFSFFA